MAKKRVNPKIEDSELLAIISGRKTSGLNYAEGALSLRREALLERYMGSKYGNEKAGQSSIVTRQCLEAVEWTLPSLLRIFLSTPTIAEFDALDENDEEQAKQETIAVNRVLRQNDGFMTILVWIKDMLMNPGAYIKVYWEETETTKTEEYTGLTEKEAEQLLSEDGVEPIEYDTNSVTLDTPVGPVTFISYDLKIHRTAKKGKVVVDPIPPEEIAIDGKITSVSLEKADFINHCTTTTRSKLVEMGFSTKVVYDLDAKTSASSERSARRDLTEGENADFNDTESNDPSSELIEVDETYLWIDYNGDGVAEYRQVMSSGDTVLSNEEHDMCPFIGVTAVPLPHSSIGQSWMELVEDIQRIYTTITRQLLDNMYRTNNPRTVVGRGVNLGDVMNDIPKLPIRALDVNQMRTEPMHPIIGQVVPAFKVFEDMKEVRIGVSKGTMGLDADALSRVTDGAYMGALEQANQRMEALARIFAESGMKPLMLKIHALLTRHQDKAYQMKQQGSWVSVNPSSWRERDDMTVTVGLGSGNKQAQVMGLKDVIAMQRADQMTPEGARLVSEKNSYNARSKFVEAVGLHNPENFFTNPEKLGPKEPPKPDPMIEVQKEFNQVEREKAKLKYESSMADIKRKYGDDQGKMQEKVYSLQAKIHKEDRDYILKEHDLIRKDYDLLINSEIEQTRMARENMPELDAAQNDFRGEMDG